MGTNQKRSTRIAFSKVKKKENCWHVVVLSESLSLQTMGDPNPWYSALTRLGVKDIPNTRARGCSFPKGGCRRVLLFYWSCPNPTACYQVWITGLEGERVETIFLFHLHGGFSSLMMKKMQCDNPIPPVITGYP